MQLTTNLSKIFIKDLKQGFKTKDKKRQIDKPIYKMKKTVWYALHKWTKQKIFRIVVHARRSSIVHVSTSGECIKTTVLFAPTNSFHSKKRWILYRIITSDDLIAWKQINLHYFIISL